MVTTADALDSVGDPRIRHIVSISGGKDSAALAIYLKQTYPQLPTEYVFCDTHCELPETEGYLNRLEALLGAKISRCDVFDVLGIKRKNRNAFKFYLYEMYGGFLPSPRSRWCTRALKIKVFEHFVGRSTAFSYIGIRADENREGYKSRKPPVFSERPNILPVYPLKDDGLQLADVHRILEDAGLGLPEYYRWRSRSGCYFCFYQQIAEWQGLKEEHPHLFEKAKQYEKTEGDKRYTWVDGRTLDQIAALPRHALKTPGDGEGCAICHK